MSNSLISTSVSSVVCVGKLEAYLGRKKIHANMGTKRVEWYTTPATAAFPDGNNDCCH